MQHSSSNESPPAIEPPLSPLLRLPTVIRITGLARTTIYRLMAEEKFPAPVRVGLRAIAWRRADLDRWSETRPNVPH